MRAVNIVENKIGHKCNIAIQDNFWTALTLIVQLCIFLAKSTYAPTVGLGLAYQVLPKRGFIPAITVDAPLKFKNQY